MERITKENAAAMSFVEMRKTATTMMAPVVYPEGAVVETKEGEYVLPAGWEGAIALDADGDPYPIALDIIAKTYEPV